MPKQRVTREMVVEAAFSLAREGGMENVMVKTLAERLDCSTQPIYSYARNMDDLRRAVEEMTLDFVRSYVRKRMDPDDLFHSVGRAHLMLAKEEPNLFKIFILQTRYNVDKLDDLVGDNAGVELYIARQLDISSEMARQLHLNMLIYTVGLGTVFAGTQPGISSDEILERAEMAYQAFLDMARKGDKQ